MSKRLGQRLRDANKDLVEAIGKRSEYAKHFKIGRGKYRAVVSETPIHYRDGSKWEEVDPRVASNNGELEVEAAPYFCRALKNKIGFTFRKRGEAGVAIVALDKIDDLPVGDIPAPQIEGDSIFWREVRPDLDFELRFYPDKAELFKHVKSESAPRKFTFKKSKNDAFNGGFGDKTIGWDSGESPTGVGRRKVRILRDDTEFRRVGTFDVQTTTEEFTGEAVTRDPVTRVKGFTNDVVYPVEIDASVSITANNSADVGYGIDGFTTAWYTSTMYVGQNAYTFRAGIRFQSVGIPNAATIDSAELQLYGVGATTGTGWKIQVELDNVDDAPQFSGSDRPENMAGIVAGSYTPALTGSGTFTITGLKTAFQSVVDRTGWSSGNDMRVALNPISAAATDLQQIDQNTNRPVLNIDYTVGGGGTPDINIQRDIITYGASEDTLTATITSVDTDHAFARTTNTMRGGLARDTALSSPRYVDDISGRIILTDSTTVTADRPSGGENVDHRAAFEAWEFPSTGNNAAFVRYHSTITMSSGTSSAVQAVSGISDIDNCIPIICGISCTTTGSQGERYNCTVEMSTSPSNGITVTRGSTTDSVTVSIAVVEFTGSNWTVDNNISHSFTSSGANETETITDVSDTATACVFSSHRGSTGGLDEAGYNCWFKDTNELYFRLRSGASTSGQVVIAHVLKHADMVVDHRDSILGGETDFATADNTVNVTVDTQDDLSTSAVIATADSNGSGTAYPRPWWNYRLTTTTNVEFYRSRSGQPADWTLQVIDFSGVTSGGATDVTVEPSVLTATASVQSPSVTAEQNVTVTPSTLTTTASVQSPTITSATNATVTPSALDVTATVQAPSVTATQNATITPSVLTTTASVQAPTIVAEQNTTVTPSTLDITASVQAPDLQIDATVTPSTLDITASVQAPTVLGDEVEEELRGGFIPEKLLRKLRDKLRKKQSPEPEIQAAETEELIEEAVEEIQEELKKREDFEEIQRKIAISQLDITQILDLFEVEPDTHLTQVLQELIERLEVINLQDTLANQMIQEAMPLIEAAVLEQTATLDEIQFHDEYLTVLLLHENA